jgi:hypothetical protein
LSVLALLAVSVFTLAAADAAGKWTAEIPGRDGNTQTSSFDLKVDGSKVTGTMSNARGEQAITEGKVDGDTISFVVVMKMGENERKWNFTGKMSGDSINFTRSMEGNDRKQEFTAKRSAT